MTDPTPYDANKPVIDKVAQAVTGKPLDKPVSQAVEETKAEVKDSLQEGFSRFDETARKVTADAADKVEEVSDTAQAYAHQGLDSLNRAGTAVAGAITQRPFVALISAMLGGAMVALARR